MQTPQEVNKPKYKRKLRNFLINPAYQLRYVFWLSFSGALLVILNAALFYWYARENYTILIDLSPMTDDVKAQLYRELHQILLRLAVISGGFLVIVGSMGVILSHRTAGAMFHFKRVFKAIKEGQRDSRIRLRPKDDFKDVAHEFNEMMDAVTGTQSPRSE